MPAPQKPLTIRTIGDLLANPPHTLSAHCPACQHSETLDLRALVARYGGDIEPHELRPLLRCRHCGHKGAEIVIGGGGINPLPGA
ncbi:MAG TPA: hypothetical protein VKU84_02190 [Stellaceae bacterium]|nr:hypothetical protein [Stellaceae bacterium]